VAGCEDDGDGQMLECDTSGVGKRGWGGLEVVMRDEAVLM